MMHNTYLFLHHTQVTLHEKLVGMKLGEAFSQSKHEHVLGFYSGENEFYIRVYLNPEFCCLSFPQQYHRAKQNTRDILKDIVGSNVIKVGLKQFDRLLFFDFDNGYRLVFQMYGNRANLFLVKEAQIVHALRNDLNVPDEINDSELIQNKALDYSKFEAGEGLKELAFLGREIIQAHKLKELDGEALFDFALNFIQKNTDQNHFTIQVTQHKPSVVLSNEVSERSIIDVSNDLWRQWIYWYNIVRKKEELLSKWQRDIDKSYRYIEKNESKIAELKEAISYRKVADVLMANLHNIQKGVKAVTLFNFYTNEDIEIKLNRKQTPQKNAENYYRKAKNQHLQVENLEKLNLSKLLEIEQLTSKMEEVKAIENAKALSKFFKSEKKNQEKEQEVLPYKEFILFGYRVWVGRNARTNDVLTLKYTHKDDLWLHAKDVQGSHVVIKLEGKSKPGENVIEEAATLAAYYSKRKTDSVCPVSVTDKKYVRKRKGDPPGAVVVEKERTVLVSPSDAKKWVL